MTFEEAFDAAAELTEPKHLREQVTSEFVQHLNNMLVKIDLYTDAKVYFRVTHYNLIELTSTYGPSLGTLAKFKIHFSRCRLVQNHQVTQGWELDYLITASGYHTENKDIGAYCDHIIKMSIKYKKLIEEEHEALLNEYRNETTKIINGLVTICKLEDRDERAELLQEIKSKLIAHGIHDIGL